MEKVTVRNPYIKAGTTEIELFYFLQAPPYEEIFWVKSMMLIVGKSDELSSFTPLNHFYTILVH